ncbi:MAG TPA: BPSS1780 family membrane protein [Cytophagaceae bacterium]|jgi:hypothetical protein|nr:BPSS1780 family membrane protein [Cytophagaceae bacterium]
MTKEELFAIAESKHDFRISYYIDEGFKIFKKNVGGFVGIVFINLLISYALGLIPYVGQILSYFISAFISAGMIVVCKKIRSGEETQFSDFFEVFKNSGQFILLLLLQFVMILLAAVPALVIFFVKYYDVFFNLGRPTPQAILAIIPLMFLALIPVLFLGMCYTFSVHIFLFINQDFWTAMEASRKVVMKNWLSMLGFSIILGLLLIIITVITCFLGYFVMLPLVVGAIYMAFEDIFKPYANAFESKIDAFGSFQKDLNTEADEKNI